MSCLSLAMLVPMTFLMEPSAWYEATTLMTQNGGAFGWWLAGNSVLAYFVNLT